jgi:hypothetical protein
VSGTVEASETDRGVDRDLARLPAPRRPMRRLALAVMVVTAALGGWLALSVAGEAVYALGTRSPVEVDDLASADLAGVSGRYLRAGVKLGDPALSFRRPLDSDRHQVAPAGPDRWVIYAIPASLDGPRFVPPSLAAGRLVRVDELGPRFRGVRDALGPAAERGWVLLDGEDPASAGWLAGLELLLLAFVAWNLWSIARVLRRAS